jgi:uncharacterized protein (DUF111 family)
MNNNPYLLFILLFIASCSGKEISRRRVAVYGGAKIKVEGEATKKARNAKAEFEDCKTKT